MLVSTSCDVSVRRDSVVRGGGEKLRARPLESRLSASIASFYQNCRGVCLVLTEKERIDFERASMLAKVENESK